VRVPFDPLIFLVCISGILVGISGILVGISGILVGICGILVRFASGFVGFRVLLRIAQIKPPNRLECGH
jgi:hypothetical protein